MRRQRIDVERIASRENLLEAAHRAGRGKRQRNDVAHFFDSLEQNVVELSARIRDGKIPVAGYRAFQIRDPKPRTIHAPEFSDRVIHHALMHHLGPRLEETLVDSSYACRPGKGSLAAVHATQKAMARYPWYVQIDISGYFRHIDHAILKLLLRTRFKGQEGLALMDQIIDHFESEPGCGLPIGTLTSQYFANFYLDGVDRFIRETLNAKAHVRYMDDIIWWTSSQTTASEQRTAVSHWLRTKRHLVVKKQSQSQRSRHGATFCGYRIRPDGIRLTRRRQRRFTERIAFWEQQWIAGRITDQQLQQAWASVQGMVIHASSHHFRQQTLVRSPAPDV